MIMNKKLLEGIEILKVEIDDMKLQKLDNKHIYYILGTI